VTAWIKIAEEETDRFIQAQVLKQVLEYLFFDNQYVPIEVDLTTAHNNYLIDVEKRFGVKARGIYILRCDDTAYIKLNSITNLQFEATPGFTLRNFYVSRIYVTNSASSVSDAKLVILLFWRI